MAEPVYSWRDSARPSRFGPFNSVATFPLVLFIFHVKVWTLLLSVTVMVFLTVLDQYGFTVSVFFRWLRGQVAANRKMATPWWM